MVLLCSEILSKKEHRVLENLSYKRSVLLFLSVGTTQHFFIETANGSQCNSLFFSSLMANMATISFNFQQKFLIFSKILVIFIWLQAKLQLFQEYRALIEIFFCSRLRKACVFYVERRPKKILRCCKAGKKPLLRRREKKIKYCCKYSR